MLLYGMCKQCWKQSHTGAVCNGRQDFFSFLIGQVSYSVRFSRTVLACLRFKQVMIIIKARYSHHFEYVLLGGKVSGSEPICLFWSQKLQPGCANFKKWKKPCTLLAASQQSTRTGVSKLDPLHHPIDHTWNDGCVSALVMNIMW